MSFGDENNIFEQLQEFLNKHGQEYSSVDKAMEAFFTQYFRNEGGQEAFDDMMANLANLEEGMDDSPEAQSLNLLDMAMGLEEGPERDELIAEAIELWPENWYAHLENISGSLGEMLDELRDLEDLAREDWMETEQVGWLNVEERAYLTVKFTLAQNLMSQGLLSEAAEHFEEIYELDEMDSLGTRYSLMSIYCRMYDWQSAHELFQSVPYPAESDDKMLVPLLVLAILSGIDGYAKDLFLDLCQVNDAVGELFQDNFFPIEDILSVSELEYYQPRSFESLAIALKDILPLIFESDYLYEWLSTQYYSQERHKKININDKVISFEAASNHYRPMPKWGDDHYEYLKFGVLIDVVHNAAQALYDRGLIETEDFLDYTEEEIRAIKHVGPKSIEQLKKNGVIFKKEN